MSHWYLLLGATHSATLDPSAIGEAYRTGIRPRPTILALGSSFWANEERLTGETETLRVTRRTSPSSPEPSVVMYKASRTIIDCIKEDVEQRYRFERIVALVSGPDSRRVDALMVELGAAGIRHLLWDDSHAQCAEAGTPNSTPLGW